MRREKEEIKKNVRDTDRSKRQTHKYRYIVPGCVFTAILVLFTVRVVWLGGQTPVLPGLLGGSSRTVTVPSLRGEIFDRNGVKLVGNSYSYELRCNPTQFLSYQGAVEKLYLMLCEFGCDGELSSYEELEQLLIGASGSEVVLSENAPMSIIAHIISKRPAGLSVEKKVSRVYEDGGYAAHVLGHTGKIQAGTLEYYSELGYPMDATVGVDGVEAAFEEYLHGKDGKMLITYDGAGNIVSAEITEESVPGNNVYLTIDIDLQKSALDALGQQVHSVGSDGGAITAADVNSGELLVCASYPTYTADQYKNDYASLSADPSAPLFNRSIQGRYAPGSVMKLATAAAALEEGIITPDTVITDEGIYTYYDNFTPQCWLYGKNGTTHGTINVRAAIQHSCNYFFFETGRLTGIEKMNLWASKLGLGEKSGIELSEAQPVLAWPASRGDSGWGEGETLAEAIGQSDNLFTPTQLCSFISVLANGGTRYSEHLLLKVCSPTGETVYEKEPDILGNASLSAGSLNVIRDGMYDAAHSGTVGNVFSGKNYEIGAKTGTAQREGAEPNAVFAAFAPYESPQISVTCVIENGSDGFNAALPAEALLTGYFG